MLRNKASRLQVSYWRSLHLNADVFKNIPSVSLENAFFSFDNRHLGVIVRWGLTWTSQINRLKVKFLYCIAVTLGILRYVLLIFNGTCRTNISALLAIQARDLRVFLGLPRTLSTRASVAQSHQLQISALLAIQARDLRIFLGLLETASTSGSIVEYHQWPISAPQVQETLCLHLQNLTGYQLHHVANVSRNRSAAVDKPNLLIICCTVHRWRPRRWFCEQTHGQKYWECQRKGSHHHSCSSSVPWAWYFTIMDLTNTSIQIDLHIREVQQLHV